MLGLATLQLSYNRVITLFFTRGDRQGTMQSAKEKDVILKRFYTFKEYRPASWNYCSHMTTWYSVFNQQKQKNEEKGTIGVSFQFASFGTFFDRWMLLLPTRTLPYGYCLPLQGITSREHHSEAWVATFLLERSQWWRLPQQTTAAC